MHTQQLDKALSLVISSNTTRGMNTSDIDKLMKSYSLIEQAKDNFLAKLISFEEYIELCRLHDVNVDSYLGTIEHNLVQFKLM